MGGRHIPTGIINIKNIFSQDHSPINVTDRQLSEQELKLELACALYARGRLGKLAGAELAGVDFFTFQGALAERGIPLYTVEMLDEDLQTVRALRQR